MLSTSTIRRPAPSSRKFNWPTTILCHTACPSGMATCGTATTSESSAGLSSSAPGSSRRPALLLSAPEEARYDAVERKAASAGDGNGYRSQQVERGQLEGFALRDLRVRRHGHADRDHRGRRAREQPQC